MVNIVIDNRKVEVPENTTILEAAKTVGISIPTLCYFKNVNKAGDCRMCLVEIEGRKGFATSCSTNVEEGMVIHTNSEKILDARKVILDLILSNHCKDCLTCIKSGNCELQQLAQKLNLDKIKYQGERKEHKIDNVSPSIVRDLNKCILCRRCIAMCKDIQNIGAIEVVNRGFESEVSTIYNNSLNDVNCTNCGQCIRVCPTGALHEKENIDELWIKLKDENTKVIIQTAPAVRAGLGEEFGLEIGTNVQGKMVNAIKQLGADYVFDTNTGADFTIVEEATELVNRIVNNGKMPMFTSCCPAWIKYAEENYPEILDNLSTCKSPHQMFGAVLKTYYAHILNIDKKDIFVVSVMPCVAKKYESKREQMIDDVDLVITTRELAKMIKYANIEFNNLEDVPFDVPFEDATGAAAIFGTSGGVMEAALRFAAEKITGKKLENIDFTQCREDKEIKESTIELDGRVLHIAIASGLKNAKKIVEDVKQNKSKYDFIEIMACPGGCIMGGGQPIVNSQEFLKTDVRAKRASVLYDIDKSSKQRKSQDNLSVQKVYEQYLGEANSHTAHQLLHTTYIPKEKYNIEEFKDE